MILHVITNCGAAIGPSRGSSGWFAGFARCVGLIYGQISTGSGFAEAK